MNTSFHSIKLSCHLIVFLLISNTICRFRKDPIHNGRIVILHKGQITQTAVVPLNNPKSQLYHEIKHENDNIKSLNDYGVIYENNETNRETTNQNIKPNVENEERNGLDDSLVDKKLTPGRYIGGFENDYMNSSNTFNSSDDTDTFYDYVKEENEDEVEGYTKNSLLKKLNPLPNSIFKKHNEILIKESRTHSPLRYKSNRKNDNGVLKNDCVSKCYLFKNTIFNKYNSTVTIISNTNTKVIEPSEKYDITNVPEEITEADPQQDNANGEWKWKWIWNWKANPNYNYRLANGLGNINNKPNSTTFRDVMSKYNSIHEMSIFDLFNSNQLMTSDFKTYNDNLMNKSIMQSTKPLEYIYQTVKSNLVDFHSAALYKSNKHSSKKPISHSNNYVNESSSETPNLILVFDD